MSVWRIEVVCRGDLRQGTPSPRLQRLVFAPRGTPQLSKFDFEQQSDYFEQCQIQRCVAGGSSTRADVQLCELQFFGQDLMMATRDQRPQLGSLWNSVTRGSSTRLIGALAVAFVRDDSSTIPATFISKRRYTRTCRRALFSKDATCRKWGSETRWVLVNYRLFGRGQWAMVDGY